VHKKITVQTPSCGIVEDNEFCYDVHQCAHSGFEPDIRTTCTLNSCENEVEELVEVRREKSCDNRHFDISGGLNVVETVNTCGHSERLSNYEGNASQGKYSIDKVDGGCACDCCQELKLDDFLYEDCAANGTV
jgi:hypothetical protein